MDRRILEPTKQEKQKGGSRILQNHRALNEIWTMLKSEAFLGYFRHRRVYLLEDGCRVKEDANGHTYVYIYIQLILYIDLFIDLSLYAEQKIYRIPEHNIL